MANVLVFKDANDKVSMCVPTAKSDLQLNLSHHGRTGFIEAHNKARDYHTANGISTLSHERRIAWAHSVADFSNITDAEHIKLVECDLPVGTKYFHWVDQSKVTVDEYFDAATDIDTTGKITYDLNKAKLIKAKKDADTQAAAAKTASDAAAAAALNSAAAAIPATSIDELKALS